MDVSTESFGGSFIVFKKHRSQDPDIRTTNALDSNTWTRDRVGIKSSLCHLLAVWFWASYLTHLSLHFLMCDVISLMLVGADQMRSCLWNTCHQVWHEKAKTLLKNNYHRFLLGRIGKKMVTFRCVLFTWEIQFIKSNNLVKKHFKNYPVPNR